MRLTLTPFDAPLLSNLINELQDQARHDPMVLRRHIVMLPTLRAARFFQDQAPQTCLLPHIITLGQTDTPTLPIVFSNKYRVLGEAEILTRLTSMIQKTLTTDHPLAIAHAARDFLRDVETFGVDEHALEKLSLQPLARHWQQNRALMDIVLHHWPSNAQDNHMITPTLAQRFWLSDLAHFLQTQPHTLHVVGVLNDTPPFLSFLQNVKPHLHLILPHAGGPEKRCDTKVNRILKILAPDIEPKTPAFSSAISQVFGFQIPDNPTKPSHIHLHHYHHLLHEVRTTALSIKKIRTQQPERRISIVCQDVMFVRHLKAALHRYGLHPDDPVGTFFPMSVEGRLILLLLEVLARPLSLNTLSAFLLHPLCVFAGEKGKFRRLGRFLLLHTRSVLALPPQRWQELPQYANTEIFQVLHRAHTAYQQSKDARGAWIVFQETLALFTENLPTLWLDIAADISQALSDPQTNATLPLPASALYELLLSLTAQTVVPTVGAQDSHIQVMGFYDAYALSHDILMMPACHDVAPRAAGEALAPPQILRDLGLPSHDDDHLDHIIAFLAHQPEVYISFTATPSRFVSRLLWFYPDLLSVSSEATLDPDANVQRLNPPLLAPCPPVAARPTRLSVSDITVWQKNPYALYASKILGLKPLRALHETAARQVYGTLMHRLCEQYLIQGFLSRPYDPLSARKLCESVFSDIRTHPFLWVFWTTKAMNVLRDLHALEQKSPWHAVALEHRGVWTFGPYTLTARADRLDENASGEIRLVDYKTGTPPTRAHVIQGLAPQLLLEALMVDKGAFEGMTGPVAALTYVHIRGIEDGRPVIETSISQDLSTLIHQTETWIYDMFQTFADPLQPYTYAPNPHLPPDHDDYTHLARA